MKYFTKPMAALALLATLLLCLTGCGGSVPAEDGRLTILATDFPAYDFAKAVTGDLAEVELLLPPGTESHSYEPTPKDILRVQGCDLFIYVGGESDAWVDTILESLDKPVRTLRMIDCVPTLEEETLEGMTGEDDHDGHDHSEGQVVEVDEHVWTAPINAMQIVEHLGAEIVALDEANAETYVANENAYLAELMALDEEFHGFFDTVEEPIMVFGDRFPLRYFAEAYGVTCYAAFPGCSTQTEPSAATIAFLTDKVRGEALSTVYYIEFSNHLVADSIAEATGAQTALFHSCHNVSKAELDSGVTYVSLMRQNLETLRQTMA